MVRHAIHVPTVGELADPRVLADLAAAAEEHGWDGVFLWDHLLRPETEPPEVADTWVALAAVAAATSMVRLGPMVSPLVRYGPQHPARAAVTLDQLSAGRLTLGLGLAHDRWGELRRFGEPTDPRARADLLDEGVDLLLALWSGEELHHRGRYVADPVRFLPTPVQRPRIPLWFAARGDARRPVRRAARYEGLFPVDVDPDQLARMLDVVAAERGGLDGFDVAVSVPPGGGAEPFIARGATWVLCGFKPSDRLEVVQARVEAGPP